MAPLFVLTRQFLQFNDNNTKCLEIKKKQTLSDTDLLSKRSYASANRKQIPRCHPLRWAKPYAVWYLIPGRMQKPSFCPKP